MHDIEKSKKKQPKTKKVVSADFTIINSKPWNQRQRGGRGGGGTHPLADWDEFQSRFRLL